MIIHSRRYGDWTEIFSAVPAVLNLLSPHPPPPPPPPPKDNTALYIGVGLSALVLAGGFALVISRRQGD